MQLRSLALIVLFGCGPEALANVARAPSGDALLAFPIERASGAAGSSVPGDQPLPRSLPPAPVPNVEDPTALLDWPTPPETVGCIVRGTQAPHPAPCDPQVITVQVGNRDVAQLDPGALLVTWGIPRKQAGRHALWVHARSGGLSATGHAREAITFGLRREVMVVPDRVWAKQEAPVIPRYTDRGVAVAIQDEVLGVGEVRGVVACDDLMFDPPEPVSTPAVLPDTREARERLYPKRSSLNLFSEPGGSLITTLRSGNESALQLQLEVEEERGGFVRVSFETRHARFDVWAALAALTDDVPGYSSGTPTGGCSRGGGRSSLTAVMQRSSSMHLGKDVPEAPPAPGLEVAEGTIFLPGERKNGFVAFSPVSSRISPPGDHRFWVPEEAVGP